MSDLEQDIRAYVDAAFATVSTEVERLRISERIGGPVPEVASTRSRRRVIAAVVAAGVVLALTVATFVIVNVGTDHPSRNAARPSPPTTTAGFSAAQIATWQWRNIPNAPIVGRSNSAAAWTGKEMLIWGGANTTLAPTQVLYGDGAAYNPAAQTWRTLPAAPLSPRTRTASVWTGTQLFVWGGYVSDSVAADDGALYDSKTERWQKLPSSPLSPRVDAQAIWTGREVIVIGGAPAILTDANRAFVDAAAYNPTTNTWRRLPPIPQTADHDTQMTTSVWVGTRLLVWDSWSHAQTTGSTTQMASGIDLLEYRPARNRWHSIPSVGSPAGLANPIWTGTEVIVPATQAYCGGCAGPAPFGLRGARYNPATNAWRPMAHGPVDDTAGPAVWTGSALIRLNTTSVIGDSRSPTVPGDGAAWDPSTDQWHSLTRAALGIGEPLIIWTGRQLIVWGPSKDYGKSGTDTSTGVALTP